MLLFCVPSLAAAQETANSDSAAQKARGTLEGVEPITMKKARAIADSLDRVKTEKRQHPGWTNRTFLTKKGQWQASYYSADKPAKEIAQVTIDDNTGGVLESWSGDQVAWTMARGYPGAFGRKVNSPWVWIPMTLLFLLPFCRGRPRMLHLDLAAFAAFGISVAYFNDAQIDKSVPIAYVLLAYLLARALWVGLHRDEDKPPLKLPLLVPVAWLAIALLFLVGFRIGLNVTNGNSNVIDVGYAGVIGADKMAKGEPLYGHFPADNQLGDTYGPVNYEAYVPFEQVMPWHGEWEGLEAAQAASITFDLICMALLFFIGWRVRGPSLGVILAYLWAAFPVTLYAMNTASNDSLVAVFALAALAATTAPARGAFTALGGLTKFGSLGLAPLLALNDRRPRQVLAFILAFVGVALIASLPIFIEHESLRTVYDRTVGYQAKRTSPFSVWGRYGWDLGQQFWQLLSVAFALVIAVVPRRRDFIGLAACMAAILIALQMGVSYWLYPYIVWFFGLYIVALLGQFKAPEGRVI